MKQPRKRVPWVLVGVCGVAGIFILGCGGGGCADFMIDVFVSSSEALFLGEGDDTNTTLPTLVAEIQPDGAWVNESQLIRCEGSGYCLERGFSLRGAGLDSGVSVEASDFVLTFDLEWPNADDTGDDGFPAVTQQGGASELVLWNGWNLDLDWGDPWNGCK